MAEVIPLPPHPDADYHQLYWMRLHYIGSAAHLRAMARFWAPLIADTAGAIADALRPAAWRTFHTGLHYELHSRKYAGSEWHQRYATLLEPQILYIVQATARSHGIPWGVAYNRMHFLGLLVQDHDGIIHYGGLHEQPT